MRIIFHALVDIPSEKTFGGAVHQFARAFKPLAKGKHDDRGRSNEYIAMCVVSTDDVEEKARMAIREAFEETGVDDLADEDVNTILNALIAANVLVTTEQEMTEEKFYELFPGQEM